MIMIKTNVVPSTSKMHQEKYKFISYNSLNLKVLTFIDKN